MTSKAESGTSLRRPPSRMTRTHSTLCALPPIVLTFSVDGAELELDTFLPGGGDFPGAGRHVVGLVLGDDHDFLAPERRAVRATSTAVMPSPMTITFCR